jgi:hypothetical protein
MVITLWSEPLAVGPPTDNEKPPPWFATSQSAYDIGNPIKN